MAQSKHRKSSYQWRCRCGIINEFSCKPKYGDTVRCRECDRYFLALFPELKLIRRAGFHRGMFKILARTSPPS